MITNRTSQDVETAKILRLKIQAGQTLTQSEIEQIERGSITITMLNRVENKQYELMQRLNAHTYMVHIECKADWTESDIFTRQDYTRILRNCDKLKQAYYTYANTPQTPTYIYGFNEANALEQILVDIETLVSDMTGRFRECGTFECGG